MFRLADEIHRRLAERKEDARRNVLIYKESLKADPGDPDARETLGYWKGQCYALSDALKIVEELVGIAK